ncbi:MAG: hypothetical protein N2512_05840 [Armatimonadetes bacterium]|nr:hypothetical protein [Armatimonadota bacterium]
MLAMRLPGKPPKEREEMPGREGEGGLVSGDYDAEPDETAQMAALEDLARSLHARGLAPAAVFVLETMRPLSFVTAEFMVFLEPFVGAFLPAEKYRIIAEALHDRRKVSWLCDRLEELDEQALLASRHTQQTSPDAPTGKQGPPQP